VVRWVKRKIMRVLLIAENANPEWVSVPLVGWSLALSLSKIIDCHLVTQIRCKEAIERFGWEDRKQFTAIDSEKIAAKLWKLGEFMRGGKGVAWTIATAQAAFANYYFEHLLWKEFRERLKSREFDVVHRIIPLSPTAPSPLARKLAKLNVPYVLGPWNGGLPWPKQFRDAQHAEREWLSYVRGAYKLMPAYAATRKHASAILVGSGATRSQISSKYQHKLVYIPENGIDPQKFSPPANRDFGLPLKVLFIGRLVPYKGADMLIEALIPLLNDRRAELTIVGDGPMRLGLEKYVADSAVCNVSFRGWVEHDKIPSIIAQHHVFGFPSVREFGGGVILEAMAMGCVPVAVNYGGVGELVTPEVGYSVPLSDRPGIVQGFRDVFHGIALDPSGLHALSARGLSRISERFTWERKAEQVQQVYNWILKRSPKPRIDFGNELHVDR